MRVESDRPANRMGGWWHNDNVHPAVRTAPHAPKPLPPAMAPIEVRNRIYREILALCGLSAMHEAYLLSCGINAASRGIYGTLNGSRANVLRTLAQRYPADLLRTIPGLWIDDRGLHLAMADGLLIGVCDTAGRITRMQCRVEQNGSKHYCWLSSSKYGGPSSGALAHCAPGTDSAIVYITEGVKKAEVCAGKVWHTTIGMASHTGHTAGMAMLEELTHNGTMGVVVALDEDADEHTRQLVDVSRQKIVAEVLSHGQACWIARWDPALGKGIDDLLLAGHKPTLTLVTAPKLVDDESSLTKRAAATEAVLTATGKGRPVDKLVAIERIWHQADVPTPNLMPAKLYIPPIAKRLGVSATTYGQALIQCKGAGIASHTTAYDTTAQANRTAFSLTMATTEPIVFPDSKRRKQGRDYHRCKACGSPNLVERKMILCADCGCVQSKQQRHVNLVDDESSETKQQEASWPEESGTDPTKATKTSKEELHSNPSPSTGQKTSSEATKEHAADTYGVEQAAASGGLSYNAIQMETSPQTVPLLPKAMQQPTSMPEGQLSAPLPNSNSHTYWLGPEVAEHENAHIKQGDVDLHTPSLLDLDLVWPDRPVFDEAPGTRHVPEAPRGPHYGTINAVMDVTRRWG
jgi:ribosomal protein L37E